ncbi:protein kinase domain-containing protein [Leifsonia shinshuensis]
MPLRPAELADAFRTGEVLGRGGSATVYAARPVAWRPPAGSRSTPIALKVLHPELARTPGAADAFFAEARALERVAHPNVVRVLGYGTTGGAAWIAFERAPGVSLTALVDDRGALLPEEAAAVTDGILRGLSAVHAAGLVHRDLSPANVFVAAGEDGALTAAGVRLIDFGLADAPGRTALAADVLRAGDAGDDEVGVVGSAGYLSTEHALGLPVDERGDLYQVAALLHLMVTGRPPFQRATAAELMEAHADAPPPVPSVQDSAIPSYIDGLVLRGMQKQPEQRFASADAMRDALARKAVTLPVPVQRATSARRQPGAPAPLAASSRLALSAGPAAAGPASAGPGTSTAAPAPRRGAPTALVAIAGALVAAIAVVWLTGAVLARPAVVPPPPAAEAPAASPVVQATPSPAPTTAVAEVAVPVLAGLTEAAAQDRLRAAGLRLGTVGRSDAASPAGTVLASAPAQGVRAKPGSAVDLTVASGSNAVPDTRGMALGDALRALSAAGFTTSSRTVFDSTVAAGTVVGSDPSPAVVAGVGSSVTVLIAGADPGGAPTATPTPGPTATATATPVPTRPPPTSTPPPRP